MREVVKRGGTKQKGTREDKNQTRLDNISKTPETHDSSSEEIVSLSESLAF